MHTKLVTVKVLFNPHNGRRLDPSAIRRLIPAFGKVVDVDRGGIALWARELFARCGKELAEKLI